MKTLSVITLAATLFMSSSVMAAGYLKIDGVDGESKDAKPAPTTPTKVDSNQQAQPAGLLLPAVQSAREAARKMQPKDTDKGSKGNTEFNWKVEKSE